jgi:hypothetical protein
MRYFQLHGVDFYRIFRQASECGRFVFSADDGVAAAMDKETLDFSTLSVSFNIHK